MIQYEIEEISFSFYEYEEVQELVVFKLRVNRKDDLIVTNHD